MHIGGVHMASWNFSAFPSGWWFAFGLLWSMQFLKGIFKACNFDLHFEWCHTSCILYKHLRMGYTTFFCFQKIQKKLYLYLYKYIKNFFRKIMYTGEWIKINILKWVNYLKEKIHIAISWSKSLAQMQYFWTPYHSLPALLSHICKWKRYLHVCDNHFCDCFSTLQP